MELFSESHGFKPVKNIMQIDSIDNELRVGLWNAVYSFYLSGATPYFSTNTPENKRVLGVCNILWKDYFKKPVDDIPKESSKTIDIIKRYHFDCIWYEVYDLIQFLANNCGSEERKSGFKEYCNIVMEREVSGYRFVGNVIAPITSKEEIAELEKALINKGQMAPVSVHLNTALERLSDKESPDYRNSIKESISAVEAMSSLIAGKEKAKLGEALNKISEKVDLHPALKKSFSSLYGYTSNADGIRHALMELPCLNFEDAKFMLVSCSAFINYLKVKASKAGIEINTS